VNPLPQQAIVVEPGNPARAATAIIDAVAHPEPPFQFLLGSDAVTTATAEVEAQRAEIQRWEAVTGTDFMRTGPRSNP
jgi:hypothetical protein